MYSVTIALMSGFFTHYLTSGWENALSGHITIEFQSNISGIDETLTDRQIDEVQKIIKSTQGVKSVKKLRESDIIKILEPLLGSTAIPDDFPFPIIFDVEIEKNASVDLLLLTDRLLKVSQGVRIHDHANWYAPIANISRGLSSFAGILVIFVFTTVCVTVIFITRKTLGEHVRTVQILQLIGATNSYIASQFKRYYFVVGCKSALVSFVCSMASIWWIVFISGAKWMCESTFQYLLLTILISLFSIFLVMITAHNTVLFFLKNDKWIY
jgi:cell division transport system permease protein